MRSTMHTSRPRIAHELGLAVFVRRLGLRVQGLRVQGLRVLGKGDLALGVAA